MVNWRRRAREGISNIEKVCTWLTWDAAGCDRVTDTAGCWLRGRVRVVSEQCRKHFSLAYLRCDGCKTSLYAHWECPRTRGEKRGRRANIVHE